MSNTNNYFIDIDISLRRRIRPWLLLQLSLRAPRRTICKEDEMGGDAGRAIRSDPIRS